jgi:Protein of unknown function (DUF2933)
MNRKHALLMVLCCLIPLAGFAAISIFRIPANTVIFVALALACPAMHLFMMRGMMNHNHDGEHGHHQVEAPKAKELETR